MDFTPVTRLMERIAQIGVPSTDIRVMKEHKLLYQHQNNVDPDDLYYIYSCSKPLTVTCAMQLYEKGYFLLDDPLYEFIPEYRTMYVRHADGSVSKAKSPITMRQLFTMTAGFNYDLDNPAFRKVKEETQGRCPTLTAIKALASEPLSFEPGARWQYSLCHDVLAAAVEAMSGEEFASYAKKHVFDVLGMEHTSYQPIEGKYAPEYRFNDEKNVAEPIPFHVPYIIGTQYASGGAGISSTAGDYVLFTDAMACGGVGANGGRILSPKTIDVMRANQLNEAQLKDYNWSVVKGYGYGLGVRTMMERGVSGAPSGYGEFGWGGAAGCYVMIDPENKLSVFYAQHMLNNKEPYIHPRIRNTVYGCLNAEE